MRVLGFVSGLAAAFSASAGEYDARLMDSGAVTGQLVYEMRFGGEAGQPAVRSLQLQIGNEGQRLAGVAPLRAEYRHETGQFLVNGIDVKQTWMSRQNEGGFLGGLAPIVIVVGLAAIIIIDGNDVDPITSGTGGTGGG